MILSFLESKILLWKVNFHIYFPQWQVMSKVSVEPSNNSSTFLFVPWSLKHRATMLDPFAQPFQHCWGNTCALHMVSKVLWAISFPWCTADPNIVGSCCIHLHNVGSCCVCLHLAEHTTLSNTFLAFCPEHSKTSKWVLKLQFLTLRQDHKDPFTFMSETHLNPPSPP